ncbi:hypothetical protein [Nocardia sp. NPDC049707]|uniref:hypothetical protein n=1 Tax=Nocardia sp. NPDC049707 TaxID=3154735 RepID=UPI0034474E47
MADPESRESTSSVNNHVKSQVPVLGSYRRRKLRAARAARGIPAMVDAEPVRDHVLWLRDIGFTDTAIGAAAGVPQKTIWFAGGGEFRQMRIEQAARIKSVTHVPVLAQTAMLVPAIGTRRRLHALNAIGYSSTKLGELLGVTQVMANRYTHVVQVRGATWSTIKDLYEELSGTPGPSPIARRYAERHNFAPPLAWEGRDIDHPDHEPDLGDDNETGAIDEVLMERILSGKHEGTIGKAEREAVLNHAIENGWGRTELAPMLNLSRESADRALVRHRDKLRKAAA